MRKGVIQGIDLVNFMFGNLFFGCFSCTQLSISGSIKKGYLKNIILLFRDSSFFCFNSLVDLFAVDFLNTIINYRFMLYYVFFSRRYLLTLTLKAYVDINDGIYSLVSFFGVSKWLEREIYDMFGIFFFNSDMRRILCDYGFEGYPLRKDFPLTGFFEVQYSEEDKLVLMNGIKINQIMRMYYFNSVWDVSRKGLI